MKNSLFLILFLSALNFPSTFAQTARLSATGKGYDNAQFTVFKYSDPITLQLKPVLKFKADAGGNIATDIPITEAQYVMIKTGIYSFRLFIQPGKTYELTLPEYKAKTNNDLNNPFFQETEFLIKQREEKVDSAKCLNEEFDATNPDCTQLVYQVYNNYLKQLAAGELKAEIATAINKGSFADLRNVVIKDNKLAEGELLDYVLLLNLYNEFFSARFNRENIIKTIGDAKTSSSNKKIESISESVLEKVTRFLPGNVLPLRPLVNSEGDSVLMSDYKGKYILLNLARSDSYSTLQEFRIVKMWQNSYDDDLKIITILTDDDFGAGVAKLRKAGYNWEIVDGSDDDELLSFFDVRIFPAFYLFDREGRILMATSLLPSEQLEKLLYEKIQNDRIRSGLLK